MGSAGYPSYILPLIVFIGLPLAITRPFKAFLMVVFLLAAADADAFTFTRTALLGPYFNANDACLLIALIAMLRYVSLCKKKIQFPTVVKWIIAVLLIGFVQSWFVMGWTYDGLRALRWAINLPVYFIIAATMVDKKEEVKPLLVALFFGSMVAAIEHIFFVRTNINIYGESMSHFRTIAFRSPGVFLLIASLVWVPKLKGRDGIIIISGCILFAISILLNQTRSIWFSTLAVLPVALLFFKHKNIHVKLIILPIILTGLLISIFILTELYIPEISLVDMIAERFENITAGPSTFARLLAFEGEVLEWSRGTLILGRGLFYYAKYGQSPHVVAWGHLGHITTLAQLGIIGLVVYSLYLPIVIIKASRRLWMKSTNEVRFFGLLAGVTIIWYWICFLMSDSFLGQHAVAGVIFGSAWRQARLIKA